ncbi:hypothetical protein AAMO2058_000843200 [Amorphochlora amoebiformis]
MKRRRRTNPAPIRPSVGKNGGKTEKAGEGKEEDLSKEGGFAVLEHGKLDHFQEEEDEDVDEEFQAFTHHPEDPQVIPDSPDNEDSQQVIPDSPDNEDSQEGERNRIGNVPLEWYDEEDHIGYGITGEKLMRKAKRDGLDEILARTDDPNRYRTIYDKLNDQTIVLSKEEMDIVHRVRQGKFPERGFDPYQQYSVPLEPMVESLHNATAPKRSFIPSKHEAKMVARIVRAIRNGWIKPDKDEPSKPKAFNIWEDEETTKPLSKNHIPAPKTKPPGHAESYNPPPEYLWTEEEKAKWLMEDPEDRPYNFLPNKFDSLREVPGYDQLIKERFERCLDLYLCPRARRKRLNIDPESLIPQLPKPETLKPFPTEELITYEGHTDKVRSISISPDGQWVASGSDDKSVKIWELSTARIISTHEFPHLIDVVAWNPNPSIPILAVSTRDQITLLHTNTGTSEDTKTAEEVLSAVSEEEKATVEWKACEDPENNHQHRMVIQVEKRMRSMVWHHKGDYLASASQDSSKLSVQIHRTSQTKTHLPFSKSKGYVQAVAFHPSKPFFFVATKRHVRVYNLSKQEMVKKLQCPARWISSLAIHPLGDNLIVGSYDCRVCWYDMDLSARPYKTLKYHKKAVRQVAFSSKYPLLASVSDDGKLHLFHGKVFDDLLTNPMIVPVKILKAHDVKEGLGILDCGFHPSQPWVLTAGADGLIKLFC